MTRVITRALTALAALAALVLTCALTSAAPASADPQARVSVTNDRGTSGADLTYRTQMTVRGSGFQSIRGGFGGVYVLFGWARDPRGGSWRPSQGGLTGKDYQYVPDAEDVADNNGYFRFVAFPGSTTSGEAAAVLSASGSFSVDLTIPGPVFQSIDRSGAVAEVDCRRVQCGVITIGAHGVVNGRNETFTPVDFGSVYDTTSPEDPTGEPTGAPTTPGSDTPSAAESDVPSSEAPSAGTTKKPDRAPATAARAPVLEVDRLTAVAGRALAFTARGFTPGEQVVGVLDDGVAALGPMVAGPSGEIAGVLQLAATTPVGTHELRLTGAASSAVASVRFPVSSSPVSSSVVAPAVAPSQDDTSRRLAYLFLTGAAVVLIAVVGLRVLGQRRRRRQATA